MTPDTVAPRVAVRIVGALLLVVAANLWAIGYVSAERFVYNWDWALYWRQFQLVGAALRADPIATLAGIRNSIASDDYNVLPILPLLPFEWAFGPGRLSYILAITNMAVVPSAALMSLVVERVSGRRSPALFLGGMATILCLHVLWAPALRGLPDTAGLVVACAIILVYLGAPPPTHRITRLVGLGLLLCLLVLTRRYYLFWAAAFFPAAMLAYLLGTPRAQLNRRDVLAVAANLAIVGMVCFALLLAFAEPLFRRVAATDYAGKYAAYRSELVGAGAVGQVADHFGLLLLMAVAGGLAWLVRRRESRALGIFLVAQAVIAFGLFTQVQSLLGVHHYNLLVPAAGIALAAAVVGLWTSRLTRMWRGLGIAAVVGVVLASSALVFSLTSLAAGPPLPRARYAPLVREDLPELQRLLATLAALRPARVYVAASSELLNWSILSVGCQDLQPDLCPHIAETQEIDMRDGFPHELLRADVVVLATPTQYHVRPNDQQVVGLVARDIREGRGIGRSFARLPGEFVLAAGVRVALYRRIAPLGPDAVQGLSDELRRLYPGTGSLFQPPRPSSGP